MYNRNSDLISRKKMKSFKLIVIFFFCSIYVFSQNYVDVLKVYASTTPYNKFDSSTSKTRINEVFADLTIPIKINDKFTLISGIIYENVQAKLFANENIKTFGSTTVKVGCDKHFNETWSGTLVLLPKIASDYVKIQSKDYQIGGIAYMKYKKQTNLNYRFGFYYNNELFGPLFVPLVGVYYLSPNKKFEATFMLPLQADMNYKIASFLSVGLNFNGQIRTYHLTDITPAYPSTYVSRVADEFYSYLKFNVGKNFIIQTKLGQSIARSYRVYNDNDKVTLGLPVIYIGHKRQQLNSDFSNGLIFQVALIYRFNLDK